MSDEVYYPRERSPAEWTYLLRRRRILRAIRHPSLTPAAKQVMVALCVQCDDPFVLPERPPVQALARHLALAERTVRQAIAELVEQLCLTFRETGEAFRPGEGPPADPVERPDLAREWAFLSEARADPSPAEHLAQLARLRDRAVAAKRIATAVSAERALGRLLAEQMRRGEEMPVAEQICHEAEAPLGPPDDNLTLVAKVNADRAMAPSARHALIEVMLDRADDPVDFPEDDRFHSWSMRIARRHGITVRGARKALAELEDLRLIAQANGDVCVYDNRVEEHLRRGTDAPQRLPLCEGLDPLRAHRHRLERLHDLALEQGLVSTALAAHRAITRALALIEASQPKAPPKPAALPAKQQQFAELTVLPFIRNLMAIDPNAGKMVLDVLDEIRSEEAAQQSSAAAM
jgi:DNA-binding transcriptional regulator YhcF (GntR family)